MRFVVRTLQRVAVLGLGVLSVWLIVFVFRWVDSSLPSILALSVTYGLAAYVILPRAVRMGLKNRQILCPSLEAAHVRPFGRQHEGVQLRAERYSRQRCFFT